MTDDQTDRQGDGQDYDAAYPGVTYEMADNVARIRLNRPEVRNAQSLPLLQALDAAFTRATQDSEVKVIVLSGAGEAFSSGHDLGTPEQAGALLGFDFTMARYAASLDTVGEDMFKNKGQVQFKSATGSDGMALSRSHELDARWEFSLAASNLPKAIAPDIRRLLRLCS